MQSRNRILTTVIILFLILSTVLTGCGGTKKAGIDIPEEDMPNIIDVSETEKEVYFKREGLNIYGKVFLPEGDGPFPTIVLFSGFKGSYSAFRDVSKKLVQNGIASVACDYIGYTSPTKSYGEPTDMTLESLSKDAISVINELSLIPEIDMDRIYLMGHSYGGLVATNIATEYPKRICGLIGLEPAYQMPQDFIEYFQDESEIKDVIYQPIYVSGQFAKEMRNFDPYAKMPEYKGPVLIIGGGKAPSIGAEKLEILEKAIDTLPNAELVIVEEADHGFSPKGRDKLIELVQKFVK